jgi:hypothetical protein
LPDAVLIFAFPVFLRSALALFLRIAGGYVSGKTKTQSTEAPSPTITTTHIVHLQFSTGDPEPIMSPPNTGLKVGPETTSDTASAIAFPRWVIGQQSLTMPPKMATGATPKRPPKKRPINTVTTFLPAADIISKSEETAIPRNMGHLRPKRSERGPKVRKPKMYPYYNISKHGFKKPSHSDITPAAGNI